MATRHSSDSDAYTVTPLLHAGVSSHLPAVRTGIADQAARLIRMRQRVVVPRLEIAEEVLVRLGVSAIEARWRARRPRPTRTCVDVHRVDLSDVSAHHEPAGLHGAGPAALLHDDSAPLLPVPFPRARRSKKHHGYATDLVAHAITASTTTLVDPRCLSATQPWVTNPGVRFYLEDHYPTKGDTYQGDRDVGNRFPLVYVRDGSEALILAGHHRSTVALLRREMLEAIVVGGSWGSRR
ncbi:MAG: hypothetical protein GY925_12340 [Actinomycetia bacterium]|nr:hypothetical protein [Actinomycetes bacterium]